MTAEELVVIFDETLNLVDNVVGVLRDGNSRIFYGTGRIFGSVERGVSDAVDGNFIVRRSVCRAINFDNAICACYCS